MIYVLIASNLCWLALAVFLVVFEVRHWNRREDEFYERQRKALAEHRDEITNVWNLHREETARLNQVRMEETANLLQRIQAPEQAVTSHAAYSADPDPAPVNLESDDAMLAVYEERVRALGVNVNGG